METETTDVVELKMQFVVMISNIAHSLSLKSNVRTKVTIEKPATISDERIHLMPITYHMKIKDNIGKESEFGDVVCPNKYTCPVNNTCCAVDGNGDYGCCGVEDAVCCDDFKHCCPYGFVCDVDAGKCNPSS
eukprot:TRINITY_DN34570_c0_g1_i1.p1 TRINITY_DN34570_c0_g1~~TRINITY_DN34570_c0_g1_i1.p1  ORF type:complete len:132 (+),score=25.24 TRINITY_DN34570_c0_g1_i1:227-622(+)